MSQQLSVCLINIERQDKYLWIRLSDGAKNIILLFSELGHGMNILQDDDKNGKTKKRKRGKCIDTIIDGR